MKRDENLGGKGGRVGITGGGAKFQDCFSSCTLTACANAFDVCFGGPFKGYI